MWCSKGKSAEESSRHLGWFQLTRQKAADKNLTFILHPIKVGQLGGRIDGSRRLQRARDRVHQENVGQRLLYVLGVLWEAQSSPAQRL